jgi:hypothetical protein
VAGGAEAQHVVTTTRSS